MLDPTWASEVCQYIMAQNLSKEVNRPSCYILWGSGSGSAGRLLATMLWGGRHHAAAFKPRKARVPTLTWGLVRKLLHDTCLMQRVWAPALVRIFGHAPILVQKTYLCMYMCIHIYICIDIDLYECVWLYMYIHRYLHIST